MDTLGSAGVGDHQPDPLAVVAVADPGRKVPGTGHNERDVAARESLRSVAALAAGDPLG